MSNFETLKKSLEEAIAYKQGKLRNIKKHRLVLTQDLESLVNPTNPKSRPHRKCRPRKTYS
jgi:hypothetical protein